MNDKFMKGDRVVICSRGYIARYRYRLGTVEAAIPRVRSD